MQMKNTINYILILLINKCVTDKRLEIQRQHNYSIATLQQFSRFEAFVHDIIFRSDQNRC